MNRQGMVGPAHLWEMKRAFQIDFLKRAGLLPTHTLLDIGCGSLRGGLPIIEYLEPGHYTGVDVRREAIDEAWKELDEAGLHDRDPCLVHCPSLPESFILMGYDYVWAFSVLFHMHDDTLHNSLAFAERHMGSHGVFFANVITHARDAGTWGDFPVVPRSIKEYRTAGKRYGLTMHDLGPLDLWGHHSGVASQDRQRMVLWVR